MAKENNLSSLSKTKTVEELADFWDTNDLTDFGENTQEVEMTFELDRKRHYVAIDPDLLKSLQKLAASRGLKTESLINLWLQERLFSQLRATP